MSGYLSDPEDLALHGPRVLGFATAGRIGARFGLPPDQVTEGLLDHEARGWVRHDAFAGSAGWSVTDAGRDEDERRMAAELDRAGARAVVVDAHQRFLPLNRRFGRACTAWQVRPTPADPLALNDHTDWRWDERALRTLHALAGELAAVCAPIEAALPRLGGYATRYAAALGRVDRGDRRWVDSPEHDSCHTVWIQLHEDLLSTLGIPRGTDG